MLKLYIIGLAILITAILANILASKLGLLSWYDFLNLLSSKGIQSLKTVRFLDYLWLLLLYPFTLGVGYWFGIKLFQIIFS